MKTYDQLRFSLMTEFKIQAAPHLRSLWADLMEMEAAADESALFAARGQASRRLLALSSAAGAADAQEVRVLSRALRLSVMTITRVRSATNCEPFDILYKKTLELTEALYAIKVPALLSERERQPVEKALVESYAD